MKHETRDQSGLPKRAVYIDHSRQIAVFDSLTQMTRGFARFAAGSDTNLLSDLDRLLAEGWVARIQFSIGSAGSLGCNLVLSSLNGTITEILSLDAPPSTTPFRFGGDESIAHPGSIT